MPLIINDNTYTSETGIQALLDVILSDETIKESSLSLNTQTIREVPPQGLLYINQREFGVIHPSDEYVKVIGADDATTCHIIVIRHSGSGVLCVAHCDGVGMDDGIREMIKTVKTMSNGDPEGRLDLHLTGGFLDTRQESIKVSRTVFQIFLESEEDVYLQTACILDHNDTVVNDVHFPIIYGLGADLQTGEIFRAKFSERGPLMDVRGATHFIGYDKMENVYEPGKGILKIGPFSWSPWKDIENWLTLPNFFIRKYMSTSPEQEPEHFEDNVRAALRVIHLHPSPSESLFLNGKALLYKLQSNGQWIHLPS